MMSKHRGFTLIELLVAITILAIVAVLGWRGLDSIVRARVALNADLEQTRGLQLAFAQMQSDASSIVMPASVGNRNTFAAQDGRVIMMRHVFAENQPSRVQVVAYRVTDGVLTRRESVATRDLRELDAAWKAALADSGGLPPVVLHSDVNAMTIRTWTGKGPWMAPNGSTPSLANANALPPMPTGLEVSLMLRDRPSQLIKIFLLGAA